MACKICEVSQCRNRDCQRPITATIGEPIVTHPLSTTRKVDWSKYRTDHKHEYMEKDRAETSEQV